MSQLMDFLYSFGMVFGAGAIGFWGFEFLKIYKRIWKRKPALPDCSLRLYVLICSGITIFCGVLAILLTADSVVDSLFLGFAIPSSAKSIAEMPDVVNNGDASTTGVTGDTIDVDDIELEEPRNENFATRVYNILFKI